MASDGSVRYEITPLVGAVKFSTCGNSPNIMIHEPFLIKSIKPLLHNNDDDKHTDNNNDNDLLEVNVDIRHSHVSIKERQIYANANRDTIPDISDPGIALHAIDVISYDYDPLEPTANISDIGSYKLNKRVVIDEVEEVRKEKINYTYTTDNTSRIMMYGGACGLMRIHTFHPIHHCK